MSKKSGPRLPFVCGVRGCQLPVDHGTRCEKHAEEYREHKRIERQRNKAKKATGRAHRAVQSIAPASLEPLPEGKGMDGQCFVQPSTQVVLMATPDDSGRFLPRRIAPRPPLQRGCVTITLPLPVGRPSSQSIIQKVFNTHDAYLREATAWDLLQRNGVTSATPFLCVPFQHGMVKTETSAPPIYCLMMPRWTCSLLDFLKGNKRFGEFFDRDSTGLNATLRVTYVCHAVRCLLEGLSLLHRAGLLHGDIGFTNLLVRAESPDSFGLCLTDLSRSRPPGPQDGGRSVVDSKQIFRIIAGLLAPHLCTDTPLAGREHRCRLLLPDQLWGLCGTTAFGEVACAGLACEPARVKLLPSSVPAAAEILPALLAGQCAPLLHGLPRLPTAPLTGPAPLTPAPPRKCPNPGLKLTNTPRVIEPCAQVVPVSRRARLIQALAVRDVF